MIRIYQYSNRLMWRSCAEPVGIVSLAVIQPVEILERVFFTPGDQQVFHIDANTKLELLSGSYIVFHGLHRV
jgi:hypothetical protein